MENATKPSMGFDQLIYLEKIRCNGSVQSFSHIWFGLSGARHWLKR